MLCIPIEKHYSVQLNISSFNSEQNPSTSTMEDPNVISLKMEHVLVVLGFCIGFGLVVCVAIVYFKFKPVRSFKMLNNSSGKKCILLWLLKIHSNIEK